VRSTNQPNDIEHTDPSRAYASPRALFDDATLSRDRKLALLRQWEYDLRSMQVASEENMTAGCDRTAGANAEELREVRRCLRALGDKTDEHAQSTKHGGNRG
jgi:hypothetical protein